MQLSLFVSQNDIAPLHVASKWGQHSVVSLLLDHQANIEALTKVSVTLYTFHTSNVRIVCQSCKWWCVITSSVSSSQPNKQQLHQDQRHGQKYCDCLGVKCMLNHCLEWHNWVHDRQWFNTLISPSLDTAAVTVDCISRLSGPVRLILRYTTPDIHRRDRRYEWDGGIRGNIIRTVLCWIVWHNVHSQQHTYMSSSYRSTDWVCHIGTLTSWIQTVA